MKTKNTIIKYTWNDHTLESFKEMIPKINIEEMLNDVIFFVENDCTLEKGDTKEMLVADLLNQIYNGKIDEDYVKFTFNDSLITNPYYDESGRFNVSPIEYYGKYYFNAIKQ